MQIGELGIGFGLSPKTIRYYEAIGLLPPPMRTAAGYRQYDGSAVSRLRFIQRAKLLGLALDDVRDILAIHERGEQPCDRVLSVIDAELARIDQRIRELNGLREDLTALWEQWSREAKLRPNAACLCPIIEEHTAVAKRPARDLTLAPTRRGRVTAAS